MGARTRRSGPRPRGGARGSGGPGGGTHAVAEQADLDAGAGALDEEVAEARAGAVGLEDVVLEVDVVARGADGLLDGGEGLVTVEEEGARRGVGGRGVAHLGGQLHELDGAGIEGGTRRSGRRLAQLARARRRGRAGRAGA